MGISENTQIDGGLGRTRQFLYWAERECLGRGEKSPPSHEDKRRTLNYLNDFDEFG